MTSNIQKVEKDLRSIAKRYKNVKFSIGMTILFLMIGVSAFSEELMSKENLKNSIDNLQTKISQTKAENEKKLSGLRLELIQLIEQGNQVVKSPWSSWQFGVAYTYTNFGKTYEGHGDKKEKYSFEQMFTRSTNFFERVTSPLSEKYQILSGTTNPYLASTNRRENLRYGLVNEESSEDTQEPLVTIEINVVVKPKNIQKDAISLNIPQMTAPILPNINLRQGTLPNFELPKPESPSKKVAIAKPNAEPFTGYYFDGTNNRGEFKDNISIYSGVDPLSLKGNISNTNPTPAAMVGAYNGREFQGTPIKNTNDRFTNIYYIRKNQQAADKLVNNTFYLRGHYDTDTYNDSNTRAHKGISNKGQILYNDGNGNGIPDEGIVGIHSSGDLKYKNIKFNLYGRAGASIQKLGDME